MPMTSDDLLTSIKRGITVPAYQARFTDADILALANEEIETVFMPMILGLREEYFVKIAIASIVSGQSEYDIPYRAVGRTIRDLRYNDGNNKIILAYVAPEESAMYTNGSSSGVPYGFYIQEDKIIIVPTPNASTGSLEIKYLLRPNELVQLADAAVITAINTLTGVVTISSALTGLTTATPIDFIQARAGNITLSYDITPTNIASTLITFTASDLPSGLAVGDYISFAGESPVVQLPEEAHPILANAVHVRLLRALGDYEGYQVEALQLQDKLTMLRSTLSPRVEGVNKVVVSRHGFIRRAPRRRFI